MNSAISASGALGQLPRIARRLPWSLMVSSALAIAFLGLRILYSGRLEYRFLVFNLSLAWIPYLLSYALGSRATRGWWQIPLLALWLAFFPNAPYLITDLIHLRARPGVPHWYDIAMFSAFGWCGMLLAVRSLSRVETLVRAHFGFVPGALFALSTSLLTGVGIYLGRFLRLNSWELFTHPQNVLAQLARLPNSPWQALGVSLAFGALTWVGYLTLCHEQPLELTRPIGMLDVE